MIDPSTLPPEPASFVCVSDLVQATIFTGEEDSTVVGACDRLKPDVVSRYCVERVGDDIELFVCVVVVEANSEEDDFHGSGDHQNVLDVSENLFHRFDQRTSDNRFLSNN